MFNICIEEPGFFGCNIHDSFIYLKKGKFWHNSKFDEFYT